jgi:hypothetical protein
MDRNLTSSALVAFSFALACGCTAQLGLANAPPLGGTTLADPRIHDDIANGPDSCGQKLDPGPLRYRVIPCPQASPSPSRPPPGASSSSANAVKVPWFEHHDAHWDCPRREDSHSSPPLEAAIMAAGIAACSDENGASSN